VAPLSNAKCSREKPLMERRYNFWYGDYNGRKTLTPLIKLCQEKNATMWQNNMLSGRVSSSLPQVALFGFEIPLLLFSNIPYGKCSENFSCNIQKL
jgi:hypothetical protein